MEKIAYLVKIEFLSFTCEDISVVMTTSVSANWKLTSHHRIFSINYLHFLKDNYVALCLIAMTFRILIRATYFLNFRPRIRFFCLLRVG